MIDWILPATDVVVAALLLLIGGNLGSFLNVVVHRLPRGESVVVGGSHCPACGASIRWHDNVPVLGWLLLRGRCRDCAAEISPRYPLVEAVGALVIGGVAAAELLSGGGTFPGGVFAGGRSGADNLLLRPDPRLIGLALFHAWLLFNLLLGAAVAADGGTLPRRWIVSVLLLTVSTVAIQDWLLPLGVRFDPWSATVTGWAGVVRGLSIAAAGMACGAILGARGPREFRDGLVLAGAALGWQSTIVIALSVPLSAWCRRRLAAAFPLESPEPPTGMAPPIDAEGMEGPAGGETPQTASSRVSARIRLGRALGAGIARSPWAAADLLVATAIHLVTWRTWVGGGI